MYYRDRAQHFITAREYLDDLSVDDLYADDISADYLSVYDSSVGDLSNVCNIVKPKRSNDDIGQCLRSPSIIETIWTK